MFIRTPQALGIVCPSLGHYFPTAWAVPPQALGIVMPQTIYSATSYSVQQRETVSGVIIDASTQETIVGASIMLKGSFQGTVTDIDGKL